MHELEQKILTFVRMNGPVLPVQISKNIDKDIIYAGAILSSLVASKQIVMTTAKIGGSPLYYIIGQESKLQVLREHLKQKEREAFDLLRSKGILRDIDVGPINRIALREIVDFAFPITVKVDDNEEIFWKWYLISDEEAKNRISRLFEPIKEEISKEIIKELPKEIVKVEEVNKTKEIIQLNKVKEIVPRIEKEIKKNSFVEEIEDYLIKNKIEVVSKELLRKGKELNMIVKLPTSIGVLNFFLKAKNKKSISNSDLVLAHNEGQQKNLPTIVLSKGKVAKKASIFIEKNLKNQLIFKQIDE